MDDMERDAAVRVAGQALGGYSTADLTVIARTVAGDPDTRKAALRLLTDRALNDTLDTRTAKQQRLLEPDDDLDF